MKRVWLALKQDVRFQYRHGFYLAYVFVTLFYVVLLSFLPDSSKPMLATMVIFSDPSFLGYFFIGGIILLEKGQGIIESLMVTPLRMRDYLLGKAFSLPLLSVMSSLVIYWAVLEPFRFTAWFLLGIWSTSIFFTLFGLGVAVRCQTLGGYFLVSVPAALIFLPPVLGYLKINDMPLDFLFPTEASLRLIETPFRPLEIDEGLVLLGNLTGWSGLAYIWAKRSVQKEMTGKKGVG
jgi:fluoroquinolone transport system permease protein